MILPEGSTRTNNSVFERIDILPSCAPPSEIGKNHVKIDCLDQVTYSPFYSHSIVLPLSHSVVSPP